MTNNGCRIEQLNAPVNDQRFLGSRQSLPERLVDAECEIRTGLMEACVVVAHGSLGSSNSQPPYRAEAECDVDPGANPPGGVDCAGFESCWYLAARGCHDGGAHAAQDFGTKPRHPVTQSLEILRVVDFFIEPATHLDAAIGGHKRLDIELRVNLVP